MGTIKEEHPTLATSDNFETMSLVLPALKEIKNASEILSSNLLTVPKVISQLYKLSATLEILKKQTNNKGADDLLRAIENEIEKSLPNCGCNNFTYAVRNLFTHYKRCAAEEVERVQ